MFREAAIQGHWSVTEARITNSVPVNLGLVLLSDLLILFMVALRLDLQLVARLVQHVLQPLVYR